MSGSKDPSRGPQIRRQNHYVAQGYLRAWARERDRIWTYRTLVSRARVSEWRQQTLRGIASHCYLYTHDAYGRHSDMVERWLDRVVEAPAIRVAAKVIGGEPLTFKDWERLICFYWVSFVRTPAYLMRRRPAWEVELPRAVEDALNRVKQSIESGAPFAPRGGPGPDAEEVAIPLRVRVRKDADRGGGIVETQILLGRRLWLREIWLAATKGYKSLLGNSWTILRPPDGVRWITSDDPAVVASISEDRRVTVGGSGPTNERYLFMPLDPNNLMYSKVRFAAPPKYSVASDEGATFIQKCLALNAHRFVFASEPLDWVSRARERTVNPEMLDQEGREWAQWDEKQSAAEREMNDEGTWPTAS
jgi:hypothetical protein